MASGIVFDLQRFSLHDGPGIRTTVFLKGCFLRCQWCHNPEAMSLAPQRVQVDQREKVYGQEMSAAEVLAVVERDRAYYEQSGGGITLSGGEPLFQFEFAKTLLCEARARHLHTCLDTSGYVARHCLAQVVEWVDLWLFDIKAHDAGLHRRLTGAANARILGNLDFLMDGGAAVVLRCPLVPGINDSPDHLRFIAGLAQRYPALRGVEIMPYHALAADKWRALGMPYALEGQPSASETLQQAWLAALHAAGCPQARLG